MISYVNTKNLYYANSSGPGRHCVYSCPNIEDEDEDEDLESKARCTHRRNDIRQLLVTVLSNCKL